MRASRESRVQSRESRARRPEKGTGSVAPVGSGMPNARGADGACPLFRRRRGFSLLEVILALAIFAMAFAFLGELSRLGMRNARVAHDKTQAELLCEGKMAEIMVLGTIPETVQGAPFETETDPSDPPWLYSVDVESTDQEGVMAVHVTVIQDLPSEQRPVEFSLVRWMLDPTSVQSSEEETTEDQMDTESSLLEGGSG